MIQKRTAKHLLEHVCSKRLLFVSFLAGYFFCALSHATPQIASLFSEGGWYDESEKPPMVGNFLLRKSQRPGAFYSFGSKILDAGEVQLASKPNVYKETGLRSIGSPNTLQFGLTDHSSCFYAFPATLDLAFKTPHGKENHSGMNNMGGQGEYEFYARTSETDSENAAGVFGITIPNGSRQVSSPWTSFFWGGSYAHTWVREILFGSAGYLVFQGPQKVRPGDVFYFEIGGGYNLFPKADSFNLNAFLEINGQHNNEDPAQKQAAQIIVNNRTLRQAGSVLSNGYLLYASPSLWYSNHHWILQFGVSIPISQYWANTRQKVDYYTSFAVTYSLN